MLRDNERSLIDLMQDLDRKYENILIVVEGKRDVRVLRDLGVKSPIIRTQLQNSRVQLAEDIAKQAGGKEVLILTDFDREGVEICRFIEQELEIRKIRVLRRLRRQIRKLMGNWRCIEEMVSLFKRKDSPEPTGL